MSDSANNGASKSEVKKLVLCFDGTGNTFQGNTSDTNIVKIYDKLNRDDDHQFHYYQPGIGTYTTGNASVNQGPLGRFASKVSMTMDQGLATSFDAHVIAGYRFLMRYYDSGDKIYMFGFSRGAFTARFLARMVNTIGLLSKGNDELVPFAYRLYQEYEQAKDGVTINPDPHSHKDHADAARSVDVDCEEARDKLNAFTSTFCRHDKTYNADHTCYSGVKIYFLGIFDCVSSVAVLETSLGKTPKPVSVVGTAEHVRHAVATDEFRVKFKCSLLKQDVFEEKYGEEEDVKEVWFPGNHGDIGGGWAAKSKQDTEAEKQVGFWARIQRFWRTHTDRKATKNVKFDPYQMSDIPLSWMIRELEMLGDQEPEYALKWSERLAGFKNNFNHQQALNSSMHNTMAPGGGSGFFMVGFWNFMDYLPLFPRWELERTGWRMRTFPANMASARDMPKSVLLHASLVWRLQNNTEQYKPRNNHGDDTKPCLAHDYKFLVADDGAEHAHKDVDHRIFALNGETVEQYKIDTQRVVRESGMAFAPSGVVAAGEVGGIEVAPKKEQGQASPVSAKGVGNSTVTMTEIFH